MTPVRSHRDACLHRVEGRPRPDTAARGVRRLIRAWHDLSGTEATEIERRILACHYRVLEPKRLREAMRMALERVRDDPEGAFRYYCGIARNWRQESQ